MFYHDVEVISNLLRTQFPGTEISISRCCRQFPETDPTIMMYFPNLDLAISTSADDQTGEGGTNVTCCSHKYFKSNTMKPVSDVYERRMYVGVNEAIQQIRDAVAAVMTEYLEFEELCDGFDREYNVPINPEYQSGERRRSIVLREYIA
jgi:hypothetical protein